MPLSQKNPNRLSFLDEPVRFLQLLHLLHPEPEAGFAGHSPISPGTEADGPHLYAVGHTAAFELLGEESAIKGCQPLFDGGTVKISFKGSAGQGIDLLRLKAKTQHIVQEEVMQRSEEHT